MTQLAIDFRSPERRALDLAVHKIERALALSRGRNRSRTSPLERCLQATLIQLRQQVPDAGKMSE